MAKKFTLRKGDHTITTTIPSEAYQLQAHGYVEVKPKAEHPRPEPKPNQK